MKPFGVQAIKSGNLNNYASDYLSHIGELNTTIKDLDGLKTAIIAKNLDGLDEILRATAVLSDLTTLTLTGGKEILIIVPHKKKTTISIPGEYIEKYKIDLSNPAVNVGVVQPNDSSHIKFLQQILPLIKRGSLILRPARILMVKTDADHWDTLNVEPDSQDDNWIVSGETKSLGEIPLRITSESKVPFDLALPYIRGISHSNFVKILEDSNDTILNLRKGLREAITNVPKLKPKTTKELRRDLIDPQLESLERNFKKIIASHRFTIGGATLGIVFLSLSAILTGGIATPISGLLGASGLGYVAKEYSEYRRKLEEMKEKPFYLFWRAKYDR